jgi:hypothetical protein
MSNRLLKFSEKEFDEIKKGIKKLFKEEIQSHKSKNFMEIGIDSSTNVIHIFTDKFNLYLRKKLSKDNKILVKSNIELISISKNNIIKNSDRIRWIIETVDKVVKLNNSSLTKIEIFAKLYKDSILENLKRENINLNCKVYSGFIAFSDKDIKFDFENENDYNFVLMNDFSSVITKDVINKVNKLISIILKYWNDMAN